MSRNIGVSLIAKNSEETISACLASLRPFVQQIVIGVDETTEDATAEKAVEAGADIVETIRVSEYHECPRHGKVLAQHFGQARNQVFQRLDPSLDLYLWIDADDILKGGELLDALGEEIYSSQAVGAWFPYHYATMNKGSVTNTIFHRERLLRTRDYRGDPIEWKWEHRVHENIIPHSKLPPQWIIKENPAVFHQEHGHNSMNSSRRNILLLEIDLETNPEDSRAMFYLGNSYFAMGNMQAAVAYYEQLAEYGKSPYELWQSWCYCSLAYERLGNLDAATGAAFRAIDINPRHPEPYYRLAAIALLSGKFDLCEYWTKQASMTEPSPPKEAAPFFVFKNPLDYNFNSKMPLADALAAQGKVKEARKILQEAYAALPDERVEKAIKHYQELERGEERASGFVYLTEGKKDEQVLSLWNQLDLDSTTRQFGRIRNRVMPIYLKNRRGLTPRIIFWCNRAYEEWSPLSITTTGIGGSETAVVEIAKRFQQDGWSVDVYNGAGRYEGEYDHVGYWDPERLTSGDECDVFVSWRQPNAYELKIKSNKAILWCHDLNYGAAAVPAMHAWAQNDRARVCGVSAWHAAYLANCYDFPRTDFVNNGINLYRYPHFVTKEQPRKNNFQCVYASSPDRGLERLLKLWPRILQREPGVTLQIGYGWDNIDKLISMGNQDHLVFKNRLIELSKATPEMEKSITWRGRLSQDELAKLYTESAIWTYPTSFLEVSCISAMEAMAGACVPVCSAVGALPETVSEGGFVVPGLPDTRVWQELWLDVFIGCLTSPQLRWPKMARGMQRVQDLTWDESYIQWKNIIESLDKPQALPEATTPQLVQVI